LFVNIIANGLEYDLCDLESAGFSVVANHIVKGNNFSMKFKSKHELYALLPTVVQNEPLEKTEHSKYRRATETEC
tara:strand:- start:295 stop:519 length:225 start_codon:yes stop_codon:yes gene_type:complete